MGESTSMNCAVVSSWDCHGKRSAALMTPAEKIPEKDGSSLDRGSVKNDDFRRQIKLVHGKSR